MKSFITLFVFVFLSCCYVQSGTRTIFKNEVLDLYLHKELTDSQINDEFRITSIILGRINNRWKIDFFQSRVPMFMAGPFQLGSFIYYGIHPIFEGEIIRGEKKIMVFSVNPDSSRHISEVLNTSLLSKPNDTNYSNDICEDDCILDVHKKRFLLSDDNLLTEIVNDNEQKAFKTIVMSDGRYLLCLNQNNQTYELTDIERCDGVFGQWSSEGLEYYFTPQKHYYYSEYLEDFIIKNILEFPVALQNLTPIRGTLEKDTMFLHFQEDEEDEPLIDSRIPLKIKSR